MTIDHKHGIINKGGIFMKKFVILLIMMFILSIAFGACTQNYSWEKALKDIDKLKNADFTIYDEDTVENLESGMETLNWEIGRAGFDFTIELKHRTALYENITTIIVFYELATEQQAQQLSDYFMKRSSQQKIVRFGKILIHTNSTKAEKLLGYDFK